MSNPCIICVAITGSVPTKADNPAVPITITEQIQAEVADFMELLFSVYRDFGFDEVILQVQKATGCSEQEAARITTEAHFKGKAVAFTGEFVNCNKVAGILREIGLVVEIQG